MKKMIWNVLFSLILVFLTIYYQRVTGPTYEKAASFSLDGETFSVELPRSHSLGQPCLIETGIRDTTISGILYFKRYPAEEPFITRPFLYEGDHLVAELPNQPPAGKLMYHMAFTRNGETVHVLQDRPVIIRFKGAVPPAVLYTHIFFMFTSMLLSNLAGILAFRNHPRYVFYSRVTLLFLFTGGLILGPMVQKYAFGLWWSGVPFGWDLTDNKLLLSFLVWLAAVLGNLKKDRPYLAFIATLLLILMYAIPHSTLGSELNYQTGKVVTGD